jgi:hypothetical protein
LLPFMSNPIAEPGAAQAFVELRRARILATVRSRPHPRAESPTLPERRAFFVREAEELYWNELAWEQMTDEELVGGEHLTELVFPGFLALVAGLLFEPSPRVPGLPSRAYPDVVEDILTFLGERCAALTAELERGADSQKVLYARAMTLRLVDLVLYRQHRLTPAEREEVERLA